MTAQQALPQQPSYEDIQQAVDHVVATHGAYIPVELLLTLGRLRYPDYEGWRCARLPRLQSVLVDTPRQTAQLLTVAADRARGLGLQPEVQTYFGWGPNAGEQLAFFAHDRHDAASLLATHYIRANEPGIGDQLDLFLDSGTTVVLQDLRAALRARDAERAEQCLATLADRDAEHRLTRPARRLIDALTELPTPLPADHVEAELASIEQVLLPAARAVLGGSARDLMAVFWQRLAVALDNRAFDPERPNLHASYAYLRCWDWDHVVAVVEAVPDHAEHPALLARLALARYYKGAYNSAVTAWCALCWLSADGAESALDGLPVAASELRAVWAAFRDLDLDPAPPTSLFPAYLLLAAPGLARAQPADVAADDSPGQRAFRVVRQLLSDDCADTRRAVQAEAPWLLAAYLERNGPI